MRQTYLSLLVVTLATCFTASRSQAASMSLSVFGSAFGTPVNETIDVSGGFTGTTIPLSSFPIGAVYGTIPEGGEKTINSPISLDLTLSSSNQTVATLVLSGTINGWLSHPAGDPDVSGLIQGSATSGSLTVFPGIDPASVPSWLPGVSASISGIVTGGGLDLLQSSLSISPGVALSSGSQTVPEPASLAIFLAWAGLGLTIRRVACPRAK